ncbi:MAG: diguanylate cyclase, partial [Lachnospiraceae bacterium]|nr:diguanylate cyclase [Lachnospiraceae bacterium]
FRFRGVGPGRSGGPEAFSACGACERVFDEVASKTNGVLTYYYRIDPSVSDQVKGFWYTNLDGRDFTEHEVTDITQYDVEDTSKLVWFTVPKHEGKPIWLPPYITDNLDIRVISYNEPIYYKGEFVGVVGIEIDYSTMAEQVDSIRLYDNGYAFINDEKGKLFYHPRIDVSTLNAGNTPQTPEGAVGDSTFLRYRYDGVDRVAAWLPLSNGMRLNVTVPVSETEGDWKELVMNILIVSVEVLIVAGLFMMLFTRRITKPLEQLTKAAEQMENGNYSHTLVYDKDDEVGRLTKTFRHLSGHMKEHISDLNEQVFIDALTHVKNKGAFAKALEELQEQMDLEPGRLGFAIGMFDCDDLKQINDRFGHEKGDEYLKTASRAIGQVFKHSPVFRVGGDEFAAILKNEDYENRDALSSAFKKTLTGINAAAGNDWERISVAMGLASYDPGRDQTVNDVVHRADKLMYADKRSRKNIHA